MGLHLEALGPQAAPLQLVAAVTVIKAQKKLLKLQAQMLEQEMEDLKEALSSKKQKLSHRRQDLRAFPRMSCVYEISLCSRFCEDISRSEMSSKATFWI